MPAMFTSVDFFYLIASFCLIAITVCVIILTVQFMQILKNVDEMSRNVEEITTLAEKVAQVVFPGILQVANKTSQLEKKVASFIQKKVEQLTKE